MKFAKYSFKFALGAGFISVCLFSSCTVSRDSRYFRQIQKDTVVTHLVTPSFDARIVPGDRLAINVTSLSPAEDAMFNAASGDPSRMSVADNIVGFYVGADGNINMHKIGAVKAHGLSRRQLSQSLEKALLPYLKDPIVTVSFLNHKITTLGNVASPRVIPLKDDPITLLDALALSGDLRPGARTDRVLIIREGEGEKRIKRINLQDKSLFNSEWYYMQPNDVVYVEEDVEYRKNAEQRQNVQATLGLVASGVTLLIIILDRIIK